MNYLLIEPRPEWTLEEVAYMSQGMCHTLVRDAMIAAGSLKGGLGPGHNYNYTGTPFTLQTESGALYRERPHVATGTYVPYLLLMRGLVPFHAPDDAASKVQSPVSGLLSTRVENREPGGRNYMPNMADPYRPGCGTGNEGTSPLLVDVAQLTMLHILNNAERSLRKIWNL
jgi:hypothetical protein